MVIPTRRGLLRSCSLLALSAPVLFSCSAEPGGDQEDSDTPKSPSDGSGGTLSASGGQPGEPPLMIPETPPTGGASGTPVEIVRTLPETFLPADAENPETSRGGYQVLGPLSEVDAPEGECANILRVIVRDFQSSHDDFENAGDWSAYEVLSPIGDTRKPEKTSDNGPLHLEEWYQNLDEVNLPFAVDLWLEPVGETFVYDSTSFFPLAGLGYMDSYLFTTELHTSFKYQGTEVFTFRGDDDVFVFINGHLAVNLSGVHEAQEGSVTLAEQATAFGLEVGNVYTFDLFQAERQPSESNFRLETTLDFTGCGVVLPVDVR